MRASRVGPSHLVTGFFVIRYPLQPGVGVAEDLVSQREKDEKLSISSRHWLAGCRPAPVGGEYAAHALPLGRAGGQQGRCMRRSMAASIVMCSLHCGSTDHREAHRRAERPSSAGNLAAWSGVGACVSRKWARGRSGRAARLRLRLIRPVGYGCPDGQCVLAEVLTGEGT